MCLGLWVYVKQPCPILSRPGRVLDKLYGIGQLWTSSRCLMLVMVVCLLCTATPAPNPNLCSGCVRHNGARLSYCVWRVVVSTFYFCQKQPLSVCTKHMYSKIIWVFKVDHSCVVAEIHWIPWIWTQFRDAMRRSLLPLSQGEYEIFFSKSSASFSRQARKLITANAQIIRSGRKTSIKVYLSWPNSSVEPRILHLANCVTKQTISIISSHCARKSLLILFFLQCGQEQVVQFVHN